MYGRACAVTLALTILPGVAAAQGSSNPVSDAFRADAQGAARNLVASIASVPPDKFGYKPTPAQMSFGDIAVHLIEGNDSFCGTIGGAKAPERSKLTAGSPKDSLVARLKATFGFCDSALANLSDSQMNDSVPFFGGRKVTRARLIMITVGDWADHYSQLANYLRLNGILPPTARRRRGG